MDALLIVENSVLAGQIERIVKNAGYGVTAMHSGAEALRRLGDRIPDLMILDFRLGDMNGLEFLAKLGTDHGAHFPILGLVDSSEEHLGAAMMKLGAAAYFEKNVEDFRRLPELIRRVHSNADAVAHRAPNDEQLQEETLRRRVLFDQSPDGILIIDPTNARFLEFNTAAHQQLGYTRDEFARLSIFDVEASQTEAETRAAIAGVLKNGKADFETRQRTRQGEVRDVHVTAQIVHIHNHPIYYCTWRDITRRKQMESNLRISEEQYRFLFDNNPAPMWVYDSETLAFLAVNDFAVYHYGYSREEFLSMTLKDIRPREDIPYLMTVLETHLGPLRKVGLVRHCKKDGTVIDVEITGHQITFNSRPAMFILALDVTDRKRAEKSLLESEKRLSDIIFSMVDWVWEVNENGRYTYSSQKGSDLFGWSNEEILGKTPFDFMPPEEAGKIAGIFGELVTRRAPIKDLANWNRRRDGSMICLLTNGVPIVDGQGTYRGYRGVDKDITSQMLAERALQESEELHRKLVAAIPHIIIRTDLEGTIVYVNESGLPVLGHTRADQVVGKNLLSFVAEQDRPRAQANMIKMIDGYLGPKEYQCQGEGRIAVDVEINGDVLRQNDGRPYGMVFSIRDLSETKKLQAQLLQAQKMEAIGRLAGGVAHDYNNMIGVILGFASLLEKQLSPQDPAHDNVRAIISAAERSAALTKQLLAFSRQQIISPVALNLNQELHALERMLGRMIGEDVKLVIHQEEALWNVNMDPIQFAQVVTNLATNARDAIENTGTITIGTANRAVGAPILSTFGTVPPGEYVMLSFLDSGIGIESALLTQIFEPFFTTKAKSKGTGLGLATVFGIIEQNNGYITVDSKPGEGTQFTIYLPRHMGEVEAAKPDAEATAESSGSKTVLIVEDEKALLELISRSLKSHGYKVLACLTPMDAIAACQSAGEPLDLLIADVIMPDMNGKELKENLEKHCPSFKTLFISGYTSDIVAKRGVLEEGMNFLQKPFTPSSLLKAVQQILKNK